MSLISKLIKFTPGKRVHRIPENYVSISKSGFTFPEKVRLMLLPEGDYFCEILYSEEDKVIAFKAAIEETRSSYCMRKLNESSSYHVSGKSILDLLQVKLKLYPYEWIDDYLIIHYEKETKVE